jgi:biotin-dependent carboxylase-like uncharacterized protein
VSRSLTVLDPGPLTTVQDGGRPGWAHLGVPRSGALDGPALDLANRLVGNDPSAAGLETTLGGAALRVSAGITVAVTGAQADVFVDDRPVGWGEPVQPHAGQVLRVGPARSGLRCYLAFSGGIDVPPILGSRSTDTLSGTGPAPLSAGDELPVGVPANLPQGADVVVPRTARSLLTLRCTLGPRDDWFTAESVESLTGSTYAVSSRSNRIGLRLEGPELRRRDRGEMQSEGIVLGAVQVPASGEPLVFLHDHPTTGGYPVVAVVHPGDLAECAQLRPGDKVRFRVT